MDIDASVVKELRERTGAGMLDCKKALAEAAGDLDRAIAILREKGLASAARKATRVAAEGIVEAYVHPGGRIGVLVELNCETDFVARTDEFKSLARDIAMQVAASRPGYVSRDEVPAAVIEAEKAIYRAQAVNEGKPERVIDKIVEGRVEKFYKEVCLTEQPFIRDPDQSVKDLIAGKVARIGENVVVRRFARFEMGEGLEKKKEDFASEVMQEIRK